MASKKIKPKKLFRSRRERIIAGVLGGLAIFTNQDPTLVRIIWLIALAFTGFLPGILVYTVAAAIVPNEPKRK